MELFSWSFFERHSTQELSRAFMSVPLDQEVLPLMIVEISCDSFDLHKIWSFGVRVKLWNRSLPSVFRKNIQV